MWSLCRERRNTVHPNQSGLTLTARAFPDQSGFDYNRRTRRLVGD